MKPIQSKTQSSNNPSATAARLNQLALVVLILLSIVGFVAAESGPPTNFTTSLIVMIVAAKFLCIGLVFMDLRQAHFAFAFAMLAYIFVMSVTFAMNFTS